MKTCTIRLPKSSSIQSPPGLPSRCSKRLPMPLQLLFDFVADGFHLSRAEPGAQQKIIGEGAEARQIEQCHFGRLLFLRGLDGRANFGSEASPFLRHRYRACLVMYSSTRGGTSPWIDSFRSRRCRTSVAETWLATVSSTIDACAAARSRADPAAHAPNRAAQIAPAESPGAARP